MLTVWGRRSSSNVQALMWTIGELGLAYERHDAGFRYGVVDTPAFLAMNPNGTVPVIKDGDQPPMFETGAILRYLAARYGDGGAFWPADPTARATVDQWAEWAKINVAASFTVPIFWQLVRTHPQDRDATLFAHGFKALNRCLDIAEPRLAAHAHLVGEAFTLADVQFGHLLYRYYDLPLDRTERPALAAYYERLEARPAFREHVIVSYDELRVPT
jgi:glutathione S-transferase